MSYETYHAIKQQPNGDFIVTSHCSNVTPARPQQWTMDYYRIKYPYETNEYRLARFLLESQYGGAVYIPEKWKRLDALTTDYSRKVFSECGRYPDCFNAEHVAGLVAFLASAPPAEKKTRFMIFCRAYNEYVSAMTMKSKRVVFCSVKEGAKVFNMTISDRERLVKRLPAYMNAETQIIKEA